MLACRRALSLIWETRGMQALSREWYIYSSDPDLQATCKKALQEGQLFSHWKLSPLLIFPEEGQAYTVLSSVSSSVFYLQN